MTEHVFNRNIGFMAAAAIFTSIGLNRSSTTQMIGGMMVSPLLIPITNSMNNNDVTKNIIQLIIMISVCVVIGMLYYSFFMNNNPSFETGDIKTIAKNRKYDYINDIIYALVAGACTYAAYGYEDSVNILIVSGIAIGIIIVPAFVSAGMLYAAGFDNIEKKNNPYFKDANFSMLLGMIYVVVVVIGYITARKINDIL